MTKPPVKLSEEQLEVFRVLYPWFKEEVFRRREQMMRLTAFGSAFLVLLLITILALSPPYPMHLTIKVFAITGTALFSALFVYLILQQRDRHRIAKQTLIEMEQVLGLYKEGLYLVGKALYPEDWQTAWLNDRSVTVYVAVIDGIDDSRRGFDFKQRLTGLHDSKNEASRNLSPRSTSPHPSLQRRGIRKECPLLQTIYSLSFVRGAFPKRECGWGREHEQTLYLPYPSLQKRGIRKECPLLRTIYSLPFVRGG